MSQFALWPVTFFLNNNLAEIFQHNFFPQQENDQELFRAIPHSYGTLGFITAVTFRLIPATP